VTVIQRRLKVYTDGAFTSKTQVGGWAWAVASDPPGAGREDSGQAVSTTSQRMEMTAALRAVQTFEDWPICIVSDSAYVVNCFEDRWYVSWKRNKWRTKAGREVANRDLWEELIPLVLKSRTRFLKVKGHSGNPMNDYVDQLAVKAKKRAI
jgi:ribonuclease HI